ncbi:MAG: hypothetical protein ACTSXZ_00030 [Alphaproteobacteria bacterium]
MLLAVGLFPTLGAGAGLPAPTQAAAKLRAWSHDGFGRMVFDWGAPVGHRLRRDGKRLEIRFDRSIRADLSLIETRLSAYVEKATLGKDGRDLRLALKGAFRHRTFRDGTAVVVDLLAAADPGDARVPRVVVRVGEHKGFSRLVVDWKRPVAYRVRRTGRDAVIRFDAPATLDLDSLRRDPPKHMAGIASARDGKGTVLRISLPEGARLRHFRSGTRVALDILSGSDGSAARKIPAAASKLPSPKPLKPVAAIHPATRKPPATKKTPATKKPGVAPPPVASATLETGQAVPVRLVKSKDGIALRFDWPELTGAAFFRRAGFLWAVFDRPGPLDPGALSTGARSVVAEYRAVPAKPGSALRLSILPGFYPRIERDGTAWVVWLGRRPLKPSSALDVTVETSGRRGPRLFIAAGDPGPPLTLRDPEVGDTLHVVPLPVLGQGIEGSRRHAKFRLLRSAQGVALESKDDDISVARLRNGVEIVARRGGLHISPADDTAAAARGKATLAVADRLLDLPRWGGFDKPFLDRKHELLMALAAAPPARRGTRRLALARFLFARGHATETLGVLRVMVETDADMGSDPSFPFLRGAARFMAGRDEDAAADLSLPELVGHVEADLWRAALAARRFEWSKAAQSYAVGKELLHAYPPAFRRRLARPAAEAALAGGFLEDTDFYLGFFEDNARSTADIAEANYLRARLTLADGEVKEGARLLIDLENSPHRLTAARAAAALTELLLYNQTITLAEAAERLEKLRFSWRGGAFEFELLSRLGTIYMEGGDYRNGLSIMKRVAANFPEKAEESGITDRMRAVFRALYLDGAADAMEPVTAIALFDEFRELTPAGAEGDAMIRKLADRLMKVDLLDRAAGLLAHQVRFRLEGESKARTGTRLAVIRLLLDEPAAALEALELSAYDAAPRKVIAERRLVRAEAMMRLSREDDALRLIEGMESVEAQRMRIAILWRQRRWASAAASIERLLDGLPRRGEPLAETESGLVLNWAVAMSLLGDEFALTRLAQRFGEALEDTPQRDAFLLVTTNADGAADYESIVAQIGAVDRFAETLASYRERVRKGRVAAVN